MNKRSDTRPEFDVTQIMIGGELLLPATSVLYLLDKDVNFHNKYDVRHPAGIYNVSTGRVIRRIGKLLGHQEDIFSKKLDVDDAHDFDDLMDDLEGVLYSAAEHVNDLETIARTCFSKNELKHKSSIYREFSTGLKELKRTFSGYTNGIKHFHQRLRPFRTEVETSAGSITLYGFFLERYNNGILEPDTTFHPDKRNISATANLIWDAVFFLQNASQLLHNFVVGVIGEAPPSVIVNQPRFTDIIVRSFMLPTYSFDEPLNITLHPLKIVGTYNISQDQLLQCAIGSFFNPWPLDNSIRLKRFRLEFEGDGVTSSFRFAPASHFKIHRWM